MAAAAVLVLVARLLVVVLLGRARARGRGRAWRCFDLAAGDDVAEAGGATLEAAAASSAFVERDADPCRLAVMVLLLRLRLLPAVVVVGAGAEEAAPGCCDIDDGEARSRGARGLPPTGCTSSGTDLAKVVAVSGARCWLLLFLVLRW